MYVYSKIKFTQRIYVPLVCVVAVVITYRCKLAQSMVTHLVLKQVRYNR